MSRIRNIATLANYLNSDTENLTSLTFSSLLNPPGSTSTDILFFTSKAEYFNANIGNITTLIYIHETNYLYYYTNGVLTPIAIVKDLGINLVSPPAAEYVLDYATQALQITLDAVDLNGLPLKWEYEITDELLTNASMVISNINNVFTITGSSSQLVEYGQIQLNFIASTTKQSITTSSVIIKAPQLYGISYVTPGTYSWTAPANVTSVSVVCVGGGGGGHRYTQYSRGGGGGGLGWKNSIPVTPGQSYTVVVGAGGNYSANGTATTATAGGDSYFIDTATVAGFGGKPGAYNVTVSSTLLAGGTYVGDGGGNGGSGGYGYVYAGGGGGAGGYTGDGGSGYVTSTTTYNGAGNPGSGGGGGGGGSCGTADTAGGGGGVGIYGQGADGAAGAGSTGDAAGGGGGSGGQSATTGTFSTTVKSIAGAYGGGGPGSDNPTVIEFSGGANGAVRIIWNLGNNGLYPNNAALLSNEIII